MRSTGHYEQIGNIQYFVPDSLPPQNPPFVMDVATTILYGEVMKHLGTLNEIASRLPDKQRFIRAYVIKEALLSSAIEGIHTTLLDVFTQPLVASKPNKNTQLVMNYTKALERARAILQHENVPISSRIILEAHDLLMSVGEGDTADPGNYRKQSVRVGDLVPAPAPRVSDLIAHLERFINTDQTLPPLIKAGLAHVQFETIHPFLDGNGRIGRLLIVLMLIDSGLLSEPILYPSYYFKKHAAEYYQRLDSVRRQGDFEGWITFYLTVIRDSASDACKRAYEIEALEDDLAQRIKKQTLQHRACQTRLRALTVLFHCPVINVSELSREATMSFNTANQIIAEFVEQGILVEETQQKRMRLFKFKSYLELLEREMLV